MSEVGKLIKELRNTHLGISLKQMSCEVGISATYLWDLERNNKRSMSLHLIDRICRVYRQPFKIWARAHLRDTGDLELIESIFLPVEEDRCSG